MKCRPAVGAATDPRDRANTVWYRSRSSGRSARLMYGGSGMCPMASTASLTERPSSVHSRIDAPAVKPALERPRRGASAGLRRPSRAPGFSFCPGCTRASQRPSPRSADEQTLDRATARDPPAEQPSRKDARVVDDQQIAGRSSAGNAAIAGVLDHAPSRAPAVSRREPPRSGGRLLRDQFRGKFEVEVADVHVRDSC